MAAEKNRRAYLPLIIIAGLVIAVAMGYFMYRMVDLMDKMTSHVASMSTDMTTITGEIIHLVKDTHDMELEMENISTRIMLMDNHMYLMNRSISSIQTRLADNLGHMQDDMQIMTDDIDRMTASITMMASDVRAMSVNMNRMGYDIYRGTSSYTSPPSFIRNMMNPR
jgi:methyl-accepting chemotaxis protein